MGAYRTVVVGTDGCDTSLRAVARAGAAGATLVVACAYLPAEDDRDLDRARDTLGDEAFQVTGSAPAETTASQAADEARTAGPGEVRTLAVAGSSVEALLGVVRREGADLLVVHTT